MFTSEKGAQGYTASFALSVQHFCESEIISAQNALKRAVRQRGEMPLKPLPGTGAYLALREEVGHQRPLHGVLHVTIREDDQGRFASQFQGNGFDSLSCRLHDLTDKHTHTREGHTDTPHPASARPSASRPRTAHHLQPCSRQGLGPWPTQPLPEP